MDVLTKKVAQEIVDKTMAVINYNVNVINRFGVIIASGNKGRIGTVHEGALIAIESKQPFYVSSQDARKFMGVQPGINLPIEFMGEIIGVIGITGDPDEVRNYGELVKMASEIFIQHFYLLEKSKKDQKIKEDFIISFLHGNSNIDTAFMAKKLGFIVDDYHCVITAGVLISEINSIDIIENIFNNLKFKFFSARNLTQYIVVVSSKSEQELKKTCEEIVSAFVSRAKKSNFKDYKLSVGYPAGGLEGLKDSYSASLDTLKTMEKYCSAGVLFTERSFCSGIAVNLTDSWFRRRLYTLWNNFQKVDKGGKLATTLLMYASHNSENSVVANMLNIHRNTLLHRLSRVKEITGQDPLKAEELITLIIAYNVFILN